MKFYYENNMGDSGVFKETNLIKAIYSAWNIQATLSLIQEYDKDTKSTKVRLVFCPEMDNEFNSALLKDFGYYMEDEGEHRVIKKIKTDEIVKYDWSDVIQLV